MALHSSDQSVTVRALGTLIWLPLRLVAMVFVLLGLGMAIAAEIWESMNMEIKTIVRFITERFWPEKKSAMSRQRYRELSMSSDMKLTQDEIDDGWFFCCEWDDMLIQKTWEEASCCTCLPEDERPNRPEILSDYTHTQQEVTDSIAAAKEFDKELF